MHTFAGYIAGDRGVVRFARNLVDLVDVDYAALRAFDIVIGRLQQFQDNIFDVFADITGLRQRRGIRHREWHVQNAGEGLRQQGFAATGWPDQNDVRLRNFDIVVFLAVRQAFIMVMHRHRENAFGVGLAYYIVVQHGADFLGCRYAIARFYKCRLVLFADDVHAKLDAFIADEYCWAGNQFSDFVLTLPAEGTIKNVFRVAADRLAHRYP